MLRKDHEALARSKTSSVDVLEQEVTDLQNKVADLLSEKANMQAHTRNIEQDKCQLCHQV